ncbi:uncharacterized protein LOC129571589 [Sitodiplosis mosellana]|uniref:uncharacterized protein LOC129571589 n=1 Tax=Sitodiplosis mosellana TaxID=263140 RepID=UPI0024442C6F|nr:uncharacterized protein LOC129571589 [Sitodiplosis mosellana]
MDYMAYEFATEFSAASKAVKTSFYVDDSLGGSHDAESAIQLHGELIEMFGRRKMKLAKWNTNDPVVRRHIKSTGSSMIELNKEETTAVLGMHWDSVEDTFQYIIKNPVRVEGATKRTVSSDIARLYDPCGYLSCIMTFAKVVLKELWHEKVEWDDTVQGEILNRWTKFAEEMPHITKARIPRWIGTSRESKKQIHGFADASMSAYGATFYLRQERENEPATSHLVFGKARVAPIRGSTIPKLELTACHLAARLLEQVRLAHDVDIGDCTLWSDSMIALHWIGKSPTKLDTFVANRVSEIQELTVGIEWRHVDTKSNPSDLASRGISPTELVDNGLWWNGPHWLALNREEWPETKLVLTELDMQVISCHERKTVAIVNAHTESDGPILNQRGSLLHQYSSWAKLLRITAYVLRFTVKKKFRTRGQLADHEIISAENIWVRHSQSTYFDREIKTITNKQNLPEGSPLSRLTPFVDDDGILRLAGRIKRSNMPYDTIHPILLSGKCTTAKLITEQAHDATLHGGTQLTQQYIRQGYWILGGRHAVKSAIGKCVPCIRQRKETQHQLMGHLPEERVTPGRPFESSAVDYAGPVNIKRYNAARKKIIDKGYIAVFVCTRTRAVHLELVSDMTTEAFIAAYTRFSSRRGRIRVLIADNSTTFQGASNEQQQIRRTFQDDSDECQRIHSTWRSLSMQNGTTTQWKFIPPSAPHMGGLHEAAVKRAKAHLKQLATLLTQVEACLNSRPLLALSDDATDELALTPGHFLVGEPIIAPLGRDYTSTAANRLKKFELMRKMTQEFWSRWSNEYVTTLMERNKWRHSQPNLKINDIVLIATDTLPPTQWPLGRVTNIIKGDDGHVRVADLTSRGHTYRRPIVKLCQLPVGPDRASSQAGPAGEDVQS